MRLSLILLIVVVACLSVGGVLYVITQAPSQPVGTLPRLRTYENKILDDENNIVMLKGVSIADPYFLDTVSQRFTENIFAELANWHVNVVRIPIHPGAWLAVGADNYCDRYINQVISWAKKYNFYIILDWHAIGNPQTGNEQGGRTWGHPDIPIYESDPTLWKSAWAKLASRYGNESCVIFELFNEPAAVDGVAPDWRRWRDTLRELIDNIRAVAPDTLILVTGWRYANDLSGFVLYPLRQVTDNGVKYLDGIGYTAHVYATHTGWEDSFGAMSRKFPFVITEWGFSSPDATDVARGSRDNYGQTFLRYMHEKGVGWTAWCFDPSWEPTILKNWLYEVTPWGQFVKEALTPDNAPPTITIDSHENGSTVVDVVTLQGTASDNLGLLTVEIKIDDGEWQQATNVFDPQYKTENWSFEWNTRPKTVGNGPHNITARVWDSALNTAEISITLVVNNPIDNTPPVATIDSPSEGESLSGFVLISGTAMDENGIESIIVMIDGEEQTAFASSKAGRDSLNLPIYRETDVNWNGLFLPQSVGDEWVLGLDTTSISNGTHTIDLRVTDNYGNMTEVSVTVEVNNGNLLADCENDVYWGSYGGGGSVMNKSSDSGVVGKAIKAQYMGSPTGWWGIYKNIYQDFSDYSGIEFYIKGTANQYIRLMIQDAGGEQWTFFITPPEQWTKMTFYFDNLQLRGDWQPSGNDGNRVVNDPIMSLQFIHTTGAYQGADGTFWIDELRFIK